MKEPSPEKARHIEGQKHETPELGGQRNRRIPGYAKRQCDSLPKRFSSLKAV